MRIAYLAPANSIHTIKWVNAFAERGHVVDLYTLSCHENRVDEINQTVRIRSLRSQGKFGYYLCAGKLKKILKEEKYDVVNAHYASGYGTLARLAKAEPLLLSVWGSDVYSFPYRNSFNHATIIKNLKYAHKIASTSAVMAEQVKKLYQEAPVVITPFGVNTELFSPRSTKPPEGPVSIGIVKSLEPQYGIDYLIRAVAILVGEKKKDVKLLVYGEGSCAAGLKELALELGIADRVMFCGRIANALLPEALHHMTMVAVPSLEESFGVVALEAMAAGLPVVTSDAPGLKEVMEDGVTGIVVSKGDERALAEALCHLADHPDIGEKMGKAGRRRVLDLYAWEKCVDIMEHAYEETASLRARSH